LRKGFFLAVFFAASALAESGAGSFAGGAIFARRLAASAREMDGILGIVRPA
jgi:hypothetical protein